MILGRKFFVWIISFGIVFIAFLLYRSTVDTGVIEITTLDSNIGSIDPNLYLVDGNSGQIGQARLEYLERARFETIDAKTRKLKRVVGFERVLHKTGNEWVLDKPYINVFQDNLRYDVTADTGTIELENVEGADPAPKKAVLKGNVLVHILPKMVASQSDSFVYLNEVSFDSDRSMFYSDDDVNFISPDAHLFGRGLEIVYNSATNKLEYLKVKSVDFLNVYRTISQKDQAESTHPKKESIGGRAAQATSVNSQKDEDSFQCLFRDNVVLEYRDSEVVLAGELAITDILSSSSQQDEQSQQIAVAEIADGKKNTDYDSAEKPKATNLNRTIVATVKCQGPMIIRPTVKSIRDDYKPAEPIKFQNLPKSVLNWLGKRNVLLAKRVSYDYKNQIARAEDYAELIFYPEAETYTKQKNEPFIIEAHNGAEFLTELNQAVFYGNVKGYFNRKTDYYDEENIFFGSKLIVYITPDTTREKKEFSADIEHITVTGPGVKLESIRKAATGEKISHIRLKSNRIDYDRITEDIIATGRGKIEYRNSEQWQDSSSPLSKPCYALMEGFDKLIWDTNAMQVKAFSERTSGVHIGYLPVLQSGFGNRITIDTRQIQIDYFEPQKGQAQLKQLYATGGIVYYEQPRYEFVGKDLYYNALDEYLTVKGSDDMPCMLNGILADAIEYDIKTGSASAVLGGGIGVMPVKE